nr:MAG TPA: hypothetical protein [Caudoviricetes sp.]
MTWRNTTYLLLFLSMLLLLQHYYSNAYNSHALRL